METLSNAMRSAANIVRGENGANKLSSSGSPRVDAFALLLQASSREEIQKHIRNMISEYKTTGSDIIIHDIFMLGFHKRGTHKMCNGELISDGEGFKNIFYYYILELYNYFPEMICELAREGIFSLFGYWKDYINMWKMICEDTTMTDNLRYTKYNNLINAFRTAMITTRSRDIKTINNYCQTHQYPYNRMTLDSAKFQAFVSTHSENISNFQVSWVGKYCVRESSPVNKKCFWYVSKAGRLVREDHVSYMIRSILFQKTPTGAVSFPDSKTVPFGAKKSWRQENATLNIFLDVPEVKFCSNNWSDLNIGKIPSVCMFRNKKGLLNEKRKEAPDSYEEDTGNRYPDSEDRVNCRKMVTEHIVSGKKINASQLLPNQIIGDPSKVLSTMEKKINEAAWAELKNITVDKMETIKQNIIANAKKTGDDATVELALASGNILFSADTSASMTWVGAVPNRPFEIAIALAAFCSELANEHYRDLIMTFSTTPSIISLRDDGGQPLPLYERIARINAAGNCGSTNYLGMHKCLIDLCVRNKIPDNARPVIVVGTDGEFNQMVSLNAHGSNYYLGSNDNTTYNTSHDNATQMWLKAGYSGPPVIVYWNLKEGRNGVQTESSRKGVIFLQGPSPSNIKYVIYGETADEVTEEVVIDGVVTKVKTKNVDPMAILRKALDQPYFEVIRNYLRKSNEKELSNYN